LDMGVDALRLDAIPYLGERDGTSCENLPETHAAIKTLRRAIDEGYANRLILAEANQWPADVRPYFGDGDECHMAFHFPLMPRIYMALRQEDRLPITDIISQTPAIPDTCQWGLFLRNHDELTLEMVTDDERDYMYLAYSLDPRMRVNLGIRRRLAPLVDNNRRRIELLISLLLSFPGTPIMYYGDEIGMGDNIYLGDRNGVRTPMQWNGDRNAGFSTATPARLYSPVIMDPVWGYEAINVEAQQGDPSSLLNWVRNMIALRKLFRVWGRGTIEFLDPPNRKVLAYIRQHEGEQVLCVANLSRFAQPVDLDLSRFEGIVPVEMLGYVDFPAIGRNPYRITLAPYAVFWFELQRRTDSTPAAGDALDRAPIYITAGWESILNGTGRQRLEAEDLPAYLPKQRWFAGKSHHIEATRVLDWASSDTQDAVLTLIEVWFENGATEMYFLPLAMTFSDAAEGMRRTNPNAVVAPIVSEQRLGVLHDGVLNDGLCAQVLSMIASGANVPAGRGRIRGTRGAAFQSILGSEQSALQVRRGSAEQSNTSIVYGDRFILKLFRKLEAGVNPDCEIGQYLTDTLHFDRVPPFAGMLEYIPVAGESSAVTVAMLQGLVASEGDAWTWAIDELERYYESVAPESFPEQASGGREPLDLTANVVSDFARDHVGMVLESAATIGRRTAELHLALGAATDNAAFAPEPVTTEDLMAQVEGIREHAAGVFDLLLDRMPQLPDDVVEVAAAVLSRYRRLLDRFGAMRMDGLQTQRIRVHGDYHLGQLLRVKTDFQILDFEGEPGRSLAERRAKQSPLKDVAGMVRSFSYAAYASLITYTTRHPEDISRLEPWAQLWERSVASAFVRAYRENTKGSAFVPQAAADFRRLLDMFLLDKALYEVRYELNNRPAWVRIPLMSIAALPA
jgi:maltose alpha-D-glucosyltransferase/alpha-amylase